MYDRASLPTCLIEAEFIYIVGASHSSTCIMPASCLYPLYICVSMHAALSCVCFAWLYTIITIIFYAYFLGYSCTYIMHIYMFPLRCTHHGPVATVTYLKWRPKDLKAPALSFGPNVSWHIKCSKPLTLFGFLHSSKKFLSPVLLDLKVKRAWRPQYSPKDQTHADSELAL